MVRRVMVLLGVGVALGAPAMPAAASGGGGCGAPVTEAAGTVVPIRQFCFTPTVLYARTGDTVTWVNRDSAPHAVGGANLVWGSFEKLSRGESETYRFTEPGVYPYVCTWHPGMIGTVVVGDVRAPAVGEAGEMDASAVSLVTEPLATEPQAAKAAPAPAIRDSSSATPWKVAAVVAGALLVLAVLATTELRRAASRRQGT